MRGNFNASARFKYLNMKRLEPKHPLAIRWFHWVNFPVLMLMIWSGLLIYWANGIYRVGIGNWTLFHFFPALVLREIGRGSARSERRLFRSSGRRHGVAFYFRLDFRD